MVMRSDEYIEEFHRRVAEAEGSTQEAIDAGPERHELLAQIAGFLYGERKMTPVTFVVRPRHLRDSSAQRRVQVFIHGNQQESRTGIMLNGITDQDERFEAYYSLDRHKGWFKLV